MVVGSDICKVNVRSGVNIPGSPDASTIKSLYNWIGAKIYKVSYLSG